MSETEHILQLVRQALDEFDDRPLDVSVRRTVRIASLLGETHLAVRLGLELKPIGGQPAANAEDTRRLMADPERWRDPDGPVEAAMAEFIADRQIHESEKIVGHSISELLWWDTEFDDMRQDGLSSGEEADGMSRRLTSHQILERTRHRAFAALCGWERQMTYSDINERIFARFQRSVDRLLADGAPEILDQFSSVYRRLRDAVAIDSAGLIQEELSQAVTSCRRILKAVADHVFPPASGALDEYGSSLDDAHYRNRLAEFTRGTLRSEGARFAAEAAVSGVYERFAAIDKFTNKGVHAEIALEEAELCAIQTYVVAGEVIRMHGGSNGAEEG